MNFVELKFLIKSRAMEELLLVHSGIDGIASAVLATANNYPADIYAVAANGIQLKFLMNYERITIIDMAIPERDIQALQKKGKTVRIYDHHSRNYYINKYGCVMDARSCATKLFYEHEPSFAKTAASNSFVTMVDVVDRWQVLDPDFDKHVELLYLFEGLIANTKPSYVICKDGIVKNGRYLNFIKSCGMKLLLAYDEPFHFTVEDRVTIDEQREKMDNNYRRTLSTMQLRQDDKERIFGLCEIHGNVSIILAKILKRNFDLEYVIAYEPFISAKTRVYARSRSIDIDMNLLEGLEGHPTAAGGLMNGDKVRKLIAKETLFIPSTGIPVSKFQRGLTPKEVMKRNSK